MFKKLMVLWILGILAVFFTSCNYAEITDLVHKDTEKFRMDKEAFLDSNIKEYRVNGVLFIPYIRQNPFESYEDKHYKYSLRLATYQQPSKNKVIINYITVEGVQHVTFNKISQQLNKALEFSEDRGKGIKISEQVLIDEINDYNMDLNEKSQIRVLLNITVQGDDAMITRDIEYLFGTKTRKYLIQR